MTNLVYIFNAIWISFSVFKMTNYKNKQDICGVVMWAASYIVASLCLIVTNLIK